ncbi:MAG: hypothetical protein WA989_12990 [Henriciella sp.]|uniref:hypothetical protein n=1 Tax=Henriciella sp. TaxID=1968823 RepID=UPI003C76DCB5
MTASSTRRAISTFETFLSALARLPVGYGQGVFDGESWGVTVERSADGRRVKLYGEALGGADHVSFNLYRAGGTPRLKPCEMPAEKVMDFVLKYRPDAEN